MKRKPVVPPQFKDCKIPRFSKFPSYLVKTGLWFTLNRLQANIVVTMAWMADNETGAFYASVSRLSNLCRREGQNIRVWRAVKKLEEYGIIERVSKAGSRTAWRLVYLPPPHDIPQQQQEGKQPPGEDSPYQDSPVQTPNARLQGPPSETIGTKRYPGTQVPNGTQAPRYRTVPSQAGYQTVPRSGAGNESSEYPKEWDNIDGEAE